MKELVVLKKDALNSDDFYYFILNDIKVEYQESQILNDIVVNVSNLSALNVLLFLKMYSVKINYTEHKKVVNSFHNYPILQMSIEDEIGKGNSKEIKLKELRDLFINPKDSYDEYIKIDKKLDITRISMSELIKLVSTDNSKDVSYFSKTLIHSLSSFSDDSVINFVFVYEKGQKSTAFRINDNSRAKLGYYDISYNPPGGRGATK